MKRNKDARIADAERRIPVMTGDGVESVEFMEEDKELLKSQAFVPSPVKERLIPKPGNPKLRRFGIPTVQEREIQAKLALELEPTFEADFKPVSYVLRP
ncbi:hypothetical protein [Arthrobacter sp. MYb214]|uniref:hypothetical protein n=1 Tax=Arthrobacter sp. MYb214 TaxID=1848596 RepID=UPI0011AFEB01|nr:hypothetical protein [Arthrobacter sp. MYb214]